MVGIAPHCTRAVWRALNPKVLAVPLVQRLRVFRFEEDPAQSDHAFHRASSRMAFACFSRKKARRIFSVPLCLCGENRLLRLLALRSEEHTSELQSLRH